MPNARRGSCAAAAFALTLAAAATAHAQIGVSLNRAGSGARAAGMADAFIAVSDDGTAASWNPAGLAQLRQPEFSVVYVVSDRTLGLSGLRSPDEASAFSGSHFNYTNGSLDFASAAVPFAIRRRAVTVQLGWHRLYQLSADLSGDIDRVPARPADPAGSVSRESRVVGDIDIFSAAGAAKLTSHLSVGGSVDLWRGRWHERYTISEEAGAAGTPAFFSTNSTNTLRGTNVAAGALLTYSSWNVGLVYHFPFTSSLRVQGRVVSSDAPAGRIDTSAPRFHLPRSVGAGIARRFGARWTIAAALTHDEWTKALLERAPGEEPAVNFFDNAPPALSTTRDTVSLNLGVEHLFFREGSVVPLRAGVGFEPQGATAPFTRDPVAYLLVSAGAGYNTNRFKLDAAVQYRRGGFDFGEVYSVGSAVRGDGPDAVGRAATREWRLKVSMIYRLADTDALRGALRRIFG
jgi:long-subunit fatty acid transport protein